MLLEGSHSINKTSLVQALAARVVVILVKINLSGQTGFSDQFSSDLPMEGGACTSSAGLGVSTFSGRPSLMVRVLLDEAYIAS